MRLEHLDYSDALRAFQQGGSAITAPVPMHPSYEDREDAPDVLLAAVAPDVAPHLASIWVAPFREAGTEVADVLHLHHLTPQHDAVHAHWPDVAIVAHLHGTEIKFLEEVGRRSELAKELGFTLDEMPERSPSITNADLSESNRELLETTRWDQWRHGEFWRERLLVQARRADHLVVVSPTDRATAVEMLGADEDAVTAVPNGVDVARFCPRPMTADARRAAFRRWLVEDPQGWDETGVPGSVAYRESQLDALIGDDGDAVVFIYVGRFTLAKRVPTLIRAFARARAKFDGAASLLIWGGHPGECETEHPVGVARVVGDTGIFFAGWRGHDDLPEAIAASDALVMPSVNDSFPQTPLEAMAVGLPVLATQSGGFPFIVNVEPSTPTGWLVPPDDEHALADSLVAVANRRVERLERGRNALEYARRTLSWSNRVADFERVYDQARDRRGQRGIKPT